MFGQWRIRWTRFSRWFDGAAYNFSNCRNDMTIAREEVFGPVLATIPFDTEDEAYDMANDSAYGRALVFGPAILVELTRASRIKAGTIWVNTYRALSYTSPFGGYKQGIGREGGLKAIYEYLETKSVWICTSQYSRSFCHAMIFNFRLKPDGILPI